MQKRTVETRILDISVSDASIFFLLFAAEQLHFRYTINLEIHLFVSVLTEIATIRHDIRGCAAW